MAPDTEVLKRKRSRPSDWWAATVSTPPQRDDRPPKKRARASGSGLSERTIQEARAAANRGKLDNLQDGPSNEGEKLVTDKRTVPKKRRGRPSAALTEQAAAPTPNAPKNEVVKKKRGRPSLSKVEPLSEEHDEGQSAPKKKKRGRPSLQQAEERATTKRPEKNESTKAPKHGRPSKVQQELKAVEQSVLETQGGSSRTSDTAAETSKRRTRHSGASDTGPESKKATSSTVATQKPRKSHKVTSDSALDGQSEANATTRGKPKKKRRQADTIVLEAGNPQDEEERSKRGFAQKRLPNDQEELQKAQTEEAPAYQHLAEVTHRVSRQVIEAKWEPLPQSCIERVSNLLEDIQRPVVVHLRDERKRTQASTALQMVSRRLVSKISKGLPFPPSTGARREDDFDFEKILDHGRGMETELTQVLHANDLLEAELRKETAHLEAEEDALLQLETNAKTEASRRREAGRKLHLLLQTEDLAEMDDSLKDMTSLADEAHNAPLSLEDEKLAALMEKLTGHVDSMQGNMKQVQGITQAMAQGKAAVQATLFSHLERAQYEDIVLG